MAKQDGNPVIVCCQSYGDGMEDYASGLFMAMKFKQLGYQVYLVAVFPTIKQSKSIEEEIQSFFEVFEPSFSILYGLSRSDIYFCSLKPLEAPFKERNPNHLFTFEELKQFLPKLNVNPALIFCPCGIDYEEIFIYYSKCPKVEFIEFDYHTFLEIEHFDPKGIYFYDLSEIVSQISLSLRSPFKKAVEDKIKENYKFYFSYFSGRRETNLCKNRTYRILEYLKLVDFLNSEEKSLILVAF